MTTIFGVDISSYQGANFNFAQAAQQGVSFSVIKATEGDNYVNPYYNTQAQNSINAGLFTMSYHFVHSADENGQVAEVENNVRRDLPVWLDSEVDGSGEYGVSVDLISRLRDAGWNVAGTYLPQWFWSQIGSPPLGPLGFLWASGYPGGSGSPAQIYAAAGGDSSSHWGSYGGMSPTLWQFTNAASVAEMSVDCSAFRGSVNDLESLVMPLTQADANLVAATLLNWDINTPAFPAGTSGRAVWDVLGDAEGLRATLAQVKSQTTPPIPTTGTAQIDPVMLQTAVTNAIQAAAPALAAAVQQALDNEHTRQLQALGYVPGTNPPPVV